MFHKEGYKIIVITFAFVVISVLLIDKFIHISWLQLVLKIALVLFFILILQFFRNPKRHTIPNNNHVLSPVDGKVVVIEEVFENEYFKDERIQISIFMSLWNVHINWFPVSGIIKYFRYHEGKYLLAKNPKSSEENERTSVVIKNEKGTEILYRQIAGTVARRVVFFVREGDNVKQSEECGFIKFGSRVDIFLPINSDVKVKIGDKVKGTQTLIAEFSSEKR
ncbi:MAG: phosphatidylserine decarboxylase family protein [Bacteroidales bacterium]|nr:phosphatidylserine decarboxylase family protein [Bacteroidales bacterium]